MSGPSCPLLIRQLRKSYGDVIAVDGIDLEIRPGECFGLLGPNGAGKTTTIEICEGLTPPDSGEVVILGRHWGRDDRTLRELLGISLQETQFSEKLTVTETIQLFRSFYPRGPAPATVIGLVQLGEMLRGAGVAQVLPELAIITAWLVLSFALAVRLFRWR
jgi:ABC-2 type transport system ATP-binding protein